MGHQFCTQSVAVKCVSLLNCFTESTNPSYIVIHNKTHPLHDQLITSVAVRTTRAVAAAHDLVLDMPRIKTVQFGRCFLPSTVRRWNGLSSVVFGDGGLKTSKTSVNLALRGG